MEPPNFRFGVPVLAPTMTASGSAVPFTPNGPVVFVIGGPGSGKGTVCAKLKQKYGCSFLSAGELLRDVVAEGGDEPVGGLTPSAISDLLAAGQMVPSAVTVECLIRGMLKEPGPYLIDGFPRSVDNLSAFEALCGPCTAAMQLDVSEDVMEQRILQRAKTSGRSDDNPAVLRTRFQTYNERSRPVEELLRQQGLLSRISAAGTPDEVFAQACEVYEMQALHSGSPHSPAASPSQ